jgi:hypothetical protein
VDAEKAGKNEDGGVGAENYRAKANLVCAAGCVIDFS